MTDKEKLENIEQIARECFSPEWSGKDPHIIDLHRAQALANIFAVFEYDGLTIEEPKKEEPEDDDAQVTFDDLLTEGGNA